MNPRPRAELSLFTSVASEGPARGSREPPPAWSVSELNRAARRHLEGRFSDLWVRGELAGWTRARSGHCYFTLKDAAAKLRCVMWARDAARLPTDPPEGMHARAFGSLTIYDARGGYQLSVRRLEGESEEGLWRLAFERIRRRLDGEGLLDPARKRPIPRFPRSVGVVTSLEGAALHDILTVIRRRAPWARVVVRSSRVQGEGASHEIAGAIRTLGASGRVEVLLVGRGGGSTEDLWAFNEEPVARAVAECPVPVISAVGHEVDVTISDLVADLRAPTPSAAAERVVQDRDSVRNALDQAEARLVVGLRAQAERRRRRLQDGSSRSIRAVRGLMAPHWDGLAQWSGRLEAAARSILLHRGGRLTAVSGRIEALSPLSTLRRGYAVPLDADSRVIRALSDFRVGESFMLRVVGGRVHCETLALSEEATG